MFVKFPVRAKHTLSANQNPKTTSAGQVEESTGWVRSLASKEVLFRVGDRRTCIYRVETGAICLYEPRWNDAGSIIDFAFPGDYVGLGFLETQSCNASAICECQVTCIPWEQLTSVVSGNRSAQQRLHEATEREFELRRTSIVKRGQENPVERVAAFLVALSRNNALEGRDPGVISDSMGCGIAADYLGLSIEKLGALLVELRNGGLIDICPDKSLRILNIEALQELANRHDDPISASRPQEGVADRTQWSQQQRALSGHLHAA
jgi:CRP/FNR family transcriptional regulator